jgi:HlyD family secretion protein
VAALGVTAYLLLRDSEGIPSYVSGKITRGDIVESVSATGTINPITTVQVGTQVNGTVKEMYVDFNTRVTKGLLIARIDPIPYQSRVDQSTADLHLSQANLEKAKAALSDTERTLNRSKALFKKNLIPEVQMDTAETNYLSAKAQVNANKAQVEGGKATLELAKINLGYTYIFSPVDGTVISRNVDVGQTVVASFQAPTLFTIAKDLTQMQIDTNVSEADIGKVQEGQEVEFTVDAYPETIFKGKVRQVRNSPITVQNVVTYDVVINVDNSELKLKPGMTANVSIITLKKASVLRVPNAALRFKPSSEDVDASQRKGSGVWIMENEKLMRINVETGITDGNYSELLSGNLKEGDPVLIGSQSKTKQQQQQQQTRGPRMF